MFVARVDVEGGDTMVEGAVVMGEEAEAADTEGDDEDVAAGGGDMMSPPSPPSRADISSGAGIHDSGSSFSVVLTMPPPVVVSILPCFSSGGNMLAKIGLAWLRLDGLASYSSCCSCFASCLTSWNGLFPSNSYSCLTSGFTSWCC